MKIFLKQSGDTIIEVLISIAILSFILVGAYATSNHSVLVLRDAKEHTDALTIAQNQIEDVVYYFSAHSTPLPSQSAFCFWNSNLSSSSNFYTLYYHNYGTGQDNCSVNANNIYAGPGLNSNNSSTAYYYIVTDTAISGANNITVPGPNHSICTFSPSPTIKVQVDWDSLLSGKNQIIMYYRPSKNINSINC